jgi:hypothetical protein
VLSTGPLDFLSFNAKVYASVNTDTRVFEDGLAHAILHGHYVAQGENRNEVGEISVFFGCSDSCA